MRWGVYGLALVIALGPSIPRLVGACSIPLHYDSYAGDEPQTPDDRTPPTLEQVTVSIDRPGIGCDCGGGCPDVGYLVLVPTASDDKAPTEFLRYTFDIHGSAPSSLHFLNDVNVGIYTDGSIGFMIDPDLEINGFDLWVTAHDLNGNESAPFVVHVAD